MSATKRSRRSSTRMKASQGTDRISPRAKSTCRPTPDRAQQVFAAMRADDRGHADRARRRSTIMRGPFSEATTAAVGGDLGWVRADAAARPSSRPQRTRCRSGSSPGRSRVPGGFSIIYLVDKRKVLTADPRDAQAQPQADQRSRSRPGTTQAQAQARAAAFAKTIADDQRLRRRGARSRRTIGAEVVDNDQ